MNSLLKFGALAACGLLFGAVGASAQILATTARQADAGTWRISVYEQGAAEQDLNFNVGGGSGLCQSQGGLATFACGQSGSVAAHGSGQAGVVKVIYQPWDTFQYYASLGAGYYDVSVPSVTVANVLSGDSPGVVFSMGARDVIYPDTIVTPAIALDAGFSGAVYRFNRMDDSAGGQMAVREQLTLLQYQLAVEASHRFPVGGDWTLEPYGGVKWQRVQADLKDFSDGSHAGGMLDVVTPFVGLRIPADRHEGLFVEASFVGGYQYAAGLSLSF